MDSTDLNSQTDLDSLDKEDRVQDPSSKVWIQQTSTAKPTWTAWTRRTGFRTPPPRYGFNRPQQPNRPGQPGQGGQGSGPLLQGMDSTDLNSQTDLDSLDKEDRVQDREDLSAQTKSHRKDLSAQTASPDYD